MDRAQRQLSRLSITGNIHENTPICVLVEIADAHGIKYNEHDSEQPSFARYLMEGIYQTNVHSVGDIIENTEWPYIARFVNRNSHWKQTVLDQAYNFLLGFMNKEDPLQRIPVDFKHGLQTPENPTAVNACVLYKTCLHHRLNVTSHTTINQMAYAVSMLRESIESVGRRVRAFVDRDARRIDLINILMISHYEIQDPDPPVEVDEPNPDVIPETNTSHDMLQLVHNSLTSIRELRQKIDPTTHCGAIALAAINYGLDISKAGDATREYKIMKLSGRSDYRPGDRWMQYWYQRNPSIFDLSSNFNPLFPAGYYDQDRLMEMAISEGYTTEDISTASPYELMQLAYVTETFYIGEMPNMNANETCIDLDPLSEVPNGELLCYGQLESPLQPITVSELTDLFNVNQNFTNPFQPNSVFTSTSINKLKLLVQCPNGPIPRIRLSGDTIRARHRLLQAISSVEVFCRSTDEPTRQLAFTYRNASPDTKAVIVTALTNLLHAGMHMRGWMGPGNEYPVIKAPVPIEREPIVAVNVTNCISNYEKSCRSLGKIGTQINNLPLVNYRDGHFQASTSPDDGFTIGERIDIVKCGHTSSNVASCIRLSSNWICSSAHKYLVGIGQPVPFDIFNLRHIS